MLLTSQWQFCITVGLSQKIVIDRSMTILNMSSKLSLTSQWQFSVITQRNSLNCQWQYCWYYSWLITENCHWLVNDILIVLQLGYHRKLSLTGQWQFRITVGLSQKIVIDWSMTIFNGNFKIVIDRSMTIFNSHFKIVIDRSMTVSHYSWVITENCHWPVNDNLEVEFKIVIDQSMTVLHYSWVITENCHWPVNDNLEIELKIVIDQSMTVSHYSWVITENCHWLVNDNLEAGF